MTDAPDSDAAGLDELELPEGALAVGDLHLDVADAGEVERFVAWLAALDAPLLVLLGDLFEYWIGDRALAHRGSRRATEALAAFEARRGPVHLIPGNRDFLLGRRFERAAGLTLHPDGFVGVTPAGERVLFLHGDELVTGDRSYQRYRRLVRRPWVRRLAGRLPQGISDRIAQRLRRVSKREVARKDADAMDVVLATCDERARAADARYLVCGHVHRHRDEVLPSGARLLVVDALGDGVLDAVRFRSSPRLVPSGMEVRPERRSALRTVVAIDGPAGAGKSTVARRVAEVLGLAFLDTGAMYRAVTLAVLERGVHPGDADACEEVARSLELSFARDGTILIDGRPGEPEIRSRTVTLNVSAVSAHPGVRIEVVSEQRAIAERLGGVVAEGRDTTTVVFPDADHKFFLDASPAERARRRAAQEGTPERVAEIEADIQRRDRLDTTRAHSPLVQAPDAIRIDGDGLDAEEVVARILALVQGGAPSPEVPA